MTDRAEKAQVAIFQDLIKKKYRNLAETTAYVLRVFISFLLFERTVSGAASLFCSYTYCEFFLILKSTKPKPTSFNILSVSKNSLPRSEWAFLYSLLHVVISFLLFVFCIATSLII